MTFSKQDTCQVNLQDLKMTTNINWTKPNTDKSGSMQQQQHIYSVSYLLMRKRITQQTRNAPEIFNNALSVQT